VVTAMSKHVHPYNIVFYLIALLAIFHNSAAQVEKQYNWIAPSPQVQLDMEGLDDIKGLGRIFMPMMTNPDFEPVYTILCNDTVIKEQKMGNSVWVRPGRYTITFGSGTFGQLLQKTIEIQAEETRIIEPDWCGLTVRIIDEAREWLTEPYELFRLPEGEAYGIGYGADEQLGENLQTWILKPGLFKIVKLGGHVNSYTNFATVRLIPGELTQFTVVMNSETKNFIGAGIVEFGKKSKTIKNWSIYSALYGSFTLNRSNDVTSEEQKTSMAFVAQLDYNLKYSTTKHYFLARGLLEEGWNMQRNQAAFRSYLDNIRIKNLYIYYFVHSIGIYGRFFLETNMFKTKYYYDKSTTVTLNDENGKFEKRLFNVNQVTLAPNFSPLELKEGIGFNLLLIKSRRTNFNIRMGMGFRQNINWRLYAQNENDNSILSRKPSTYLRGPEAALIGNIRLFRNVMVTSELDLLLPSDSENKLVYDWENNINLKLSKNISLDYTLRIKKDPSLISYVQYEHILLLRYSYVLF